MRTNCFRHVRPARTIVFLFILAACLTLGVPAVEGALAAGEPGGTLTVSYTIEGLDVPDYPDNLVFDVSGRDAYGEIYRDLVFMDRFNGGSYTLIGLPDGTYTVTVLGGRVDGYDFEVLCENNTAEVTSVLGARVTFVIAYTPTAAPPQMMAPPPQQEAAPPAPDSEAAPPQQEPQQQEAESPAAEEQGAPASDTGEPAQTPKAAESAEGKTAVPETASPSVPDTGDNDLAPAWIILLALSCACMFAARKLTEKDR